MLEWLKENYDNICVVITALITFCSVVVKVTPTDKDDKILSKIISILDKILADLPSKLYNNCTRIAIVEKTIDGVKDRVGKVEGNISWVTKTILGIVITAIMGIIVVIR